MLKQTLFVNISRQERPMETIHLLWPLKLNDSHFLIEFSITLISPSLNVRRFRKGVKKCHLTSMQKFGVLMWSITNYFMLEGCSMYHKNNN